LSAAAGFLYQYGMDDLTATQRCVKCGLCLPHCPTFNLTGNEADSPRGRISLMQLLERPPADWSPGIFNHLDQCLLCRACEAMCPSQVPFEQLMDTARARLEPYRRRTLVRRSLYAAGLWLLTSRTGRRVSPILLAFAQRLPLQRLAGWHGLPGGGRRLLHLLPAPIGRARKSAQSAQADAPSRGRLSLFTGCTGELFDRQALQASQRLLRRCGYQVAMPAGQGCCGALHQHTGHPTGAQRLIAANVDAFGADQDPVLTFATGCTAQLLGYRHQGAQGERFAARVRDVMDFLATEVAPTAAFKPHPETIALFLPCSQRNVLKQQTGLTSLLAQIPQLNIVVVNPDGGCCGAAGSYMLSQPQLSDRLSETMVERVINSGASTLVSANIGCSLQLRAALRRHGVDMAVQHPMILLDELLVPAPGLRN